MFKQVFTSALIAGLAAGALAALLQLTFVVPLLMEGELYEFSDRVHFRDGQIGSPRLAPQIWGELPRHFGTFGSNLVTYTGFALIMVAAFLLAQKFGKRIDARTGMIWGLAGFLAVNLAPAFGLPPELPGTASAGLIARQTWWLFAALGTVSGVALLGFGRNLGTALLGTVAIAAPQLVGAPHLDAYYGVAPPELATLYAVRSIGVAAVAWVAMGWLAGFLWEKSEG